MRGPTRTQTFRHFFFSSPPINRCKVTDFGDDTRGLQAKKT